MNLDAKLTQVMPLQTGVGKNGEWQKQNYIFLTDGTYPKTICVTVWGEKCSEYKAFKVGENYNVNFDLESREYNGNWYTEVKAWKIEPLGASARPQNNQPAQQPSTPALKVDFKGGDGDDLPF